MTGEVIDQRGVVAVRVSERMTASALLDMLRGDGYVPLAARSGYLSVAATEDATAFIHRLSWFVPPVEKAS